MNTDAESVVCYTDTTRAWMIGRLHCRLPGSPENGRTTFARFDGVVDEIVRATDPDGTALLVAHGTVLRLWTALAAAVGGGVEPAWIADHPMRNAGVSVAEGDPEGGWRLVDWNEGEWRA